MRGPGDGFGVLYHEKHEFAVYLIVQGVHLIVLGAETPRCVGIATDESVQLLVKEPAPLLSHARDVNQGLQGRLITDHEGDLGNPFGVIPHALQLDSDVGDSDDDPQIAGQGLLGGDQNQAPFLQVAQSLINQAIFINDLLGQLQVTVGQGLDGALYSPIHQIAQGQEIILQLADLFVEGLPRHRSSPPAKLQVIIPLNRHLAKPRLSRQVGH